MLGLSLLRVVVDTNVVFEGLTKQGGASGLVSVLASGEKP